MLSLQDLRRSERFYRAMLGREPQQGHPPVAFESYAEGGREALRIFFPGDDFSLELSQPDADKGQGDLIQLFDLTRPDLFVTSRYSRYQNRQRIWPPRDRDGGRSGGCAVRGDAALDRSG